MSPRSSRRRCSGRPWICWLGWSLVVVLVVTLVPVLAWRWLPPPVSAVMFHRAVQESSRPEFYWVSLEEIAPAAALAVVAAEDQHFPEHAGFDVDAITAAWRTNREGGTLRGASTISQQVAKNLFLWEGRSYLRKGLEAWYTLWLEILWTKHRILEMYLNIAEMGEDVFGVEAASRRFFGKPAARLTDPEAALLAAVLPNPVIFRVDSPGPAALRRRDWVLRQMNQLGGTRYLHNVL